MNQDIKRQNFNVNADQIADLEAAQAYLHAPTIKDAMLRSARVVNLLARELQAGKKLVVVDGNGQTSRLVISDLETGSPSWNYLCARPHPWRTQLYIKGRKLLASTVWNDLIANDFTPEEAAEDRDLPVEAVLEAIRYSEQNLSLIRMEAEEEKARILSGGIQVNE